jgi:hypothetical protein
MSIDWLFDVERDIDNGREIFACPGIGQNEWILGRPLEETRRLGQRAADAKKMAISVYRVKSKHDTILGDLYLVPTKIEAPGARGEPQIKWSVVDTREAGEMMRDVRHGPSPFFGVQVVETLEPRATT